MIVLSNNRHYRPTSVQNDDLCDEDSIIEEGLSDILGSIKGIISKVKDTFNLTKFREKIKQFQARVPKRLAEIRERIARSGVDIKKLNRIVNEEVRITIKDFKTNRKEFQLSKHVSRFSDRCQEELTDDEKITLSIITLCAVIFICTFIQSSLIAIGVSDIALATISNVLIAPLVEESSKYFAASKNMSGHYFIVFNLYEWSRYILLAMGGAFGAINLGTYAMMRFICVLAHGVTVLIHEHLKDSTEDNRILGWLVAVFLHMSWNSGLGDKVVSAIMAGF